MQARQTTALNGADGFGPLFLCLAEALKVPLGHIARQAELSRLTGRAAADLADIQTSADASLRLLDSYAYSVRTVLLDGSFAERQPVSVAATLHQTARQLAALAGQYGVELDVHVQGVYGPVLADETALRTALLSLGYALVEALPAVGTAAPRLRLATHRTRDGLVAGIYGEFAGLTPHAWRRARQLHGHARQPLGGVLPSSGAGLFVADAILRAMSARLRVGRFQRLPGFAVTLPPSEQLQLI